MIKPCIVDLETFAIEPRPSYPPKPVGVSIKYPDKPARYYAFGHPTENNSTWEEARAVIAKAYECPDGVIFHHAKFDLCVIKEHFGIPYPPLECIHDTRILLFLNDPYRESYSLKPAAAQLLDMPPEEQDAVAEWLIANPPDGVKISRSPKSPHYFAKYIAYAPGKLVGKYADGDVIRTEKLFEMLYPRIIDGGMQVPYLREIELMLVLMGIEETGIPVDTCKLETDVMLYEEYLFRIDAWLRSILGNINFDSDAQLVDALLIADKVDPNKLLRTPTGKLSANKKSLALGLTDPILTNILKYRSQLETCLNTFMKPWLATAKRSGGLIFTDWIQTRRGADDGGARTGRLSSSPNFMNMPKVFKMLFAHEKEGLPECPIEGLPVLPNVRGYIRPFPGHVLIGRDFSSQEIRVYGHFEGKILAEAFELNPWLDLHEVIRIRLAEFGYNYGRKDVKTVNFSLIYGSGVPALAALIGCSHAEANKLQCLILNLFPGLRAMQNEMRLRARLNKPIRTWGGRLYYCEPPKFIKGRLKTFDYKMVNTLVQGSSADLTKQALIDYSKRCDSDCRIMLTVHDEIVVSCPQDIWEFEMSRLKFAMDSLPLDVPLKSEGYVGFDNWGSLTKYDKEGIKVYG